MVERSRFYSVPTHRLGNGVEEQFITHDVTAQVYRGREADDPENPQQKMCLNLEQVRLAIEAGQSVTPTCCSTKPRKGAERRCAFYDTCGYQRQFRGTLPDICIGAHELLFHEQSAFGKIAMVIVDEDFWEDGIRIDKHSVSIAEMAGALIPSKGKEDLGAELDELRNRLATAMRHQPNVGGFDRRHLDGMTVEQCTHAIRLEWKMVERFKLWPGMRRAELDKVARSIPAMRRAKRMVGIWGAVRELLQKPEISVSGRLVLDDNKAGERFETPLACADPRAVAGADFDYERDTALAVDPASILSAGRSRRRHRSDDAAHARSPDPQCASLGQAARHIGQGGWRVQS